MGFEPMTFMNTGAMLYQLSYEATHWEPQQAIFVVSIFPMKEIDERINEIILHGREEASNYMILTMSPPIYAIGERSLKQIQGFNGI